MRERIEYLRCRISELKRLDEDRGYALLLAIELRMLLNRQRQIDAVLSMSGGTPLGLELRHTDGRLIAILPEPDGSSKARLVRYGPDGFYGHEVFNDPMKALDEAVCQGFVQDARGALDAFVLTPVWQRGMRYSAMLQRYNEGRMSFEEFCRRSREEAESDNLTAVA